MENLTTVSLNVLQIRSINRSSLHLCRNLSSVRYATRSAILPYPIPEISSVISSIVSRIKSADCGVYDLTIATALHSVVLAVLRITEYRYIVRIEVTPHARSLNNFTEFTYTMRRVGSISGNHVPRLWPARPNLGTCQTMHV